MTYRFEVVRPEKYALIECLEINLKKAEGREKALMIDLLGMLYNQQMKEIIQQKESWIKICRQVYAQFIPFEDRKVHLGQIARWENRLDRFFYDPYKAGILIQRAFNIFLKHERD